MVERGKISSIDKGSARVVVSERMDSVTAPLFISAGALDQDGQPPPPGIPVVFVEFPDGSGVILARLEG